MERLLLEDNPLLGRRGAVVNRHDVERFYFEPLTPLHFQYGALWNVKVRKVLVPGRLALCDTGIPQIVGSLEMLPHQGVPEGEFVKAWVHRELYREPGGHIKRPMLNQHSIFEGRFCLIILGQNDVSFGQKSGLTKEQQNLVTKETRQALPNFLGIIVRSFVNDEWLSALLWEIKALGTYFAQAPVGKPSKEIGKIFDAPPLLDHVLSGFGVQGNITVSSHTLKLQCQQFFGKFGVTREIEVSEKPFEHYGVEEFWHQISENRIPVQGGGEIIIETTSALTTVDCNQGSEEGFASHLHTFRENAMRAIAQQLRWKDIGGMVVIDPISMPPSQRPLMLKALQDVLVHDFRHVNLFGWTRMGLIELARKRKGISLMARLQQIG